MTSLVVFSFPNRTPPPAPFCTYFCPLRPYRGRGGRSAIRSVDRYGLLLFLKVPFSVPAMFFAALSVL